MLRDTAGKLPGELIVDVLQRIEQKERLTTCAFVGKQWQNASKTATTSISCRSGSYASLSAWLGSNSNNSKITDIEVHSRSNEYSTPLYECFFLPVREFGNLQSLELVSCSVRAAAGGLDPIASLTALTRLELKQCNVDISGIVACTRLQHLYLEGVKLPPSAQAADRSKLSSVLESALPQLQHLTNLTLKKHHTVQELDGPAISKAISSLQRLAELTLPDCKPAMTAASIAFIPTSLTKLELHSLPELTVDSAPRLQELKNLQYLRLSIVRLLDPALLSGLTKLQHLKLDSVGYQGSAAVASLMTALSHMKQLQFLDVFDSFKDEHFLDNPELYAALTSSSQLTYLATFESFFTTGAAQHIFAADRPCKGLKQLSVGAELFSEAGSFERLVSCCPRLELLEVYHSTGESNQIDIQGLTALQPLTTLTQLDLGGVLQTNEALGHIASCVQLQKLRITLYPETGLVTLEGFKQLTQLTALTELEVLHQGTNDELIFNNRARAGDAPNVWRQLRRYCRRVEASASV